MSKQNFSEVRRCEHCSNRAPMERLHGYSQTETVQEPSINMQWEEGWIYELLICPACQRLILRRYFWHEASFDPSEGVSYETLYPTERKSPLGLPQDIAQAYEAAQKVRSIDANSFGVLLGRLLENICLDRSASGSSLHDQLADLAEKGEIPKKLLGVVDGLRKLRNIGAHASLGELTESELPILDDLARAVIEYVYTAPYLAEEAQRRLDSLKKVATLKKAIKKSKKKGK